MKIQNLWMGVAILLFCNFTSIPDTEPEKNPGIKKENRDESVKPGDDFLKLFIILVLITLIPVIRKQGLVLHPRNPLRSGNGVRKNGRNTRFDLHHLQPNVIQPFVIRSFIIRIEATIPHHIFIRQLPAKKVCGKQSACPADSEELHGWFSNKAAILQPVPAGEDLSVLYQHHMGPGSRYCTGVDEPGAIKLLNQIRRIIQIIIDRNDKIVRELPQDVVILHV